MLLKLILLIYALFHLNHEDFFEIFLFLRYHAHSQTQWRTIDAHLPEHRRDIRHRSRTYWVDRARRLGEAPLELVETIFDSDDVLHQLRKVQAVVKHLEGFPRKRACNAARRAIHYGCLNYQGVKSILSKGLDLEPLQGEEESRDWARHSRHSRNPTQQALAFMMRGGNDDSR